MHRYYDNEDLKKLLRIAFLYHQGWKVSKIADLSESRILEEVRQASIHSGHEQYLVKLTEAAIDFNEAGFSRLLTEIKDRIGFERTIVEVCYPYLQKLGLLWSTNNVIPAQEHFSSYIIQNRVIAETEGLPIVNRQPEIILFCPQGEFHELPLLFINYLLRKNGRSTLYLGPDISKEELLSFSQLPSIEYMYLHLITNFTGLYADEYLAELCSAFEGRKIIASGSGIRYIQRSFVNLRLLQNDQQIYDFINEVRYEHSS